MDLPSSSIGPEKVAPLDSWWNVTSCSDHNDSNSKFTLLVVVAKMSLSSVFSFLTLAGRLKHNSNWTNMSYPLLVQREPGEIMLRLRFVVRDPEPVISAIHRVSRKKSKWKLKRPESFINVLDHCNRCVKRLSLKSNFMIGGNHFECVIFPHFFHHIHKRLD